MVRRIPHRSLEARDQVPRRVRVRRGTVDVDALSDLVQLGAALGNDLVIHVLNRERIAHTDFTDTAGQRRWDAEERREAVHDERGDEVPHSVRGLAREHVVDEFHRARAERRFVFSYDAPAKHGVDGLAVRGVLRWVEMKRGPARRAGNINLIRVSPSGEHGNLASYP